MKTRYIDGAKFYAIGIQANDVTDADFGVNARR